MDCIESTLCSFSMIIEFEDREFQCRSLESFDLAVNVMTTYQAHCQGQLASDQVL